MPWLGAVLHQAITWAQVDPDLCRHMASLSHNELKNDSHLLSMAYNSYHYNMATITFSSDLKSGPMFHDQSWLWMKIISGIQTYHTTGRQ